MASQLGQAPAPEPPRRFPAHYLWAVLIARIYKVFPLVCPLCGGNMRLIAFITEGVEIRQILEHVGVNIRHCVSPLHAGRHCGTSVTRRAQRVPGRAGGRIEPDRGEAAQMAPHDALDQRTDW